MTALGVDVDVTVDGWALTDLRERIERMRTGLYPRLTERLEQHFDETFETQGANISQPWAPLSQVTLKIDAELGRNPRPVEQASGVGLIRRSLTQGGPYSLRQTTDDRVRAGTTHSMAAIQQRGERRKRPQGRTMVPPRVLAGAPVRLASELVHMVDAYLDQGF